MSSFIPETNGGETIVHLAANGVAEQNGGETTFVVRGSGCNLAAYATGKDVEAYIKSLGIINPDTYDVAFALMNCGLKAQAASVAWEQLVGWHPYLSSGNSQEMRRFDPPGPNHSGWGRGGGKRLNLNAGLLQLTTLQTNMSALFNAPNVLLPDLDYWLLDRAGNYDPVALGKAIEEIEFTVPQYGVRASIHVTGLWGRYAVLPANVWLAIRHYAAYLCFAELALQITRGLFSFKDLNVEIKYASGRITPLAAEAQAWYNDFHALAQQEMRTWTV